MKKTVYKLVNDLPVLIEVYLSKEQGGRVHCYSLSSAQDPSGFEGTLGINLFETKEELLESKIKSLEQSVLDSIENIKYEVKELRELKRRMRTLKEQIKEEAG